METVQSNQMSESVQLGFWDSIKGLLMIDSVFLLGIIVIAIVLIIMFKKNKGIAKASTSILSLLMYYYLCLMLTNIVGIPSLSEYIRLSGFGESFFNPNINLVPLSDGLSLSFILNIFLFIPLGFLCPMISSTYKRVKNIILLGVGLSLLIEITQLFTLYRASDIDDLLTNVLGTMVGYLCFRFLLRLKVVKSHCNSRSNNSQSLEYLPIIIIVIAFVVGFFR